MFHKEGQKIIFITLVIVVATSLSNRQFTNTLGCKTQFSLAYW